MIQHGDHGHTIEELGFTPEERDRLAVLQAEIESIIRPRVEAFVKRRAEAGPRPRSRPDRFLDRRPGLEGFRDAFFLVTWPGFLAVVALLLFLWSFAYHPGFGVSIAIGLLFGNVIAETTRALVRAWRWSRSRKPPPFM